MEGTEKETKRNSLLLASSGVGRYVVRLLTLAALYVATGWVGHYLGAVSGFATLVWVPSGLAVTALFLWGPAWWPAITLGAFLFNFLTGAPWYVAVGISIGNTLEALLATALLKRAHVRPALDSLHDVLVLVLLAAPTSAFVSATLGVGSLLLGGAITWSVGPVSWGTWWLGDLMSLLLLTPFLLTWSAWPRVTLSRSRLTELSLLSASVLVIGLVVFLGLLRPHYWEYPVTQVVFPLLIVFPLLLWGALRFGLRGATALIITFASLAIVGTILGVSPFSTGSLWQRLLFLQSFMGITAATTLILAAMVAERHALEQRTRETLGALVAMGEALVQVQPVTNLAEPTSEAPVAMAEALVETSDQAPDAARGATPRADQVARRLAELTRHVLGCQYVSMAAVSPATQTLTPLTVVGLSPEEERQWWASWHPPLHVGDGLPPGAVAALWRGEPILLDTPQALLPIRQHVLPERQAVLVPMRVGETLVGMLRVDRRAQGEEYTDPNKQTLTRAVTRLGALVLERERLLRERAEARASELALRETTAQMDTFLGIAGHELKNPLTSLKLALQLIERTIRRQAQQEPDTAYPLALFLEQVARARQQAARLERLVNELLDVSRVRAGKLDLHLQPTDLAALVREAVDEQRKVHPERALVFQLPPERPVPVVADADRLGQVVTNYLTNALKYSRAECPVEVGLEVDERQARVWVRDQGPGIPPEEQARIWERFHRVKGIQVQSGTGVGLGLGLHICRMIVERHQGQVGVESAPEQGSTFWFIVPLERQE